MRFVNNDAGSGEGEEVNMTPMIDCVFLLLIFFLVATVVKKTEKEVEVDLPEAIHAVDTKYAESKTTVIGVGKESELYMNGAAVTVSELHRHLREIAQATPEARIRIDGDRDAPFQALTHVLDLCSFEGLKIVGIHTAGDPQKTTQPPAVKKKK